jgi:predicted Zn-dependent protease
LKGGLAVTNELLAKKCHEIDVLIDEDKYAQARSKIRPLLRSLPKDPWLLHAMTLSYYWERDYRQAIKFSALAVAVAPNEPACLWDHGRVLARLRKPKDAIRFLEKLIRMGAVKAGIQSTMGTRWARELINDARFLVTECYLDVRNRKAARKHILAHLRLRGQGVPSVFFRRDADRLLIETGLSARTSEIDALIQADKYSEACVRICPLLRHFPTDAYLLNDMALAYYERRMYKRALQYSLEAVAITPNDPLYLFNHAGILGMVGKVADSIRVFEKIIKMGPVRAGTVECSEGVTWARSLINDARFRVADFYLDAGECDKAHRYVHQHLRLRTEGVRSMYPRRDAVKLLKKIQAVNCTPSDGAG